MEKERCRLPNGAGRKAGRGGGRLDEQAVSRRFVAATETALGELLARRWVGWTWSRYMIDGVHFGEHLCVVALGIGIDGIKHPLGLVEGSTREHQRGHRSADRVA